MTKKRHQPPAQIRYSRTHPTVSIRVSADLYAKLKDLREKSGKSLGDILREALKKQAPTTYKAFENGYSKAKEEFGVVYNCTACGRLLHVKYSDEKRAIAGYMTANGWRHVNCPNT